MRERLLLDPVLKFKIFKLPFFRSIKCLHRWCCRSENNFYAFKLCPCKRHIPCIVSQTLKLFVRCLLLFIHHNQPRIFKWREDRAPDADNYPDFAFPHPAPMGYPLPDRKAAVKKYNVFPESTPEPVDHLCRNRDLRDKYNRLFTSRQCLDRVNVNLRLPAPGNSMQEKHPVFCLLYLLQCLTLFRRKNRRLC